MSTRGWLVRFHGFSSETGRALSYQRGAETSEAVKEGERKREARGSEGRRVRRIDSQTLGAEGRKEKRNREKKWESAETEERVHRRALCVRKLSQGLRRHPVVPGRIIF